ncbi:DNA cytosine methyltransferase [Mesorhizobium onobrychidis]|uniref:DNA cytosine methyltransferase n=1 Tax=Mesorhizobium onobrychidis TaxID=2775404 RepID=A0ABY5QVJ4_9HYPH|nr:DNA cytosine methyltransferase [Mesorhizobium onobrychidis]
MNHVALRPERLDILSICTGGGGLDLGVGLAIPGARSVVLVEREAFACAQLVSAMEAGLLHQAPIWSDARTFDGRRWRGCVDGLIGGIPCQAHSLAGKKRGSLDERDLWSPARRIIVQARPWFVLIENVGGMLSPGDDDIAGAERVWRDLRKLGFSVEGGLFTAAEVGASHERERIFILAVADSRGERAAAGLPAPAGRHGIRPEPAIAYNGGDALVDAARDGRREGRAEPKLSQPHGSAAAFPGSSMDDTTSHRGREGRPVAERQQAADETDVDAHGAGAGYLFPPGPSDSENWQAALERAPELEPAFRRVADGLASRLDVARVDRLRMLGNGVVPLQAAYAVRTLATRLAGRGSAGATRLVRMMEDQA